MSAEVIDKPLTAEELGERFRALDVLVLGEAEAFHSGVDVERLLALATCAASRTASRSMPSTAADASP